MRAERVALTGATGLVGFRTAQLLQASVQPVPLGRAEGFDLSKPDASSWRRRLPQVDAILHLGAKTDVDAIERERSLGAESPALIVNHGATQALCEVAETRSIPLVLVSTDFAFPSSMRGPYPEAPVPTKDPRETSWYGWTKALAERSALVHRGNAVLRISYPFGARHPSRADHAERVLALHRGKTLYPLFDDQEFTPSHVDDVAASLATLLRKRLRGVHHCASATSTTPFEFGQRIVAAAGSSGPPLARASFQGSVRPDRAPRPQHGGLQTILSRKNGLVCRDLHTMVTEFGQHWTRNHHTSSARSSY